MNGWLIAAAVLTVLASLWSRERVQDAVITGVYQSLDRWLERWLSLLLPVLTLICIGVAMRGETRPPGGGPDPPPPPPPQPVVAQFRVVGRKADGSMAGIPMVVVRVGQDRVESDAEGRVKLLAASSPSPDTLVQFSHREYVPHFLPFRDASIGGAGDIELKPVMRVVTIDMAEGPPAGADRTGPVASASSTSSTNPDSSTGSDSSIGPDSTRHSFESAFVRNGLELVTSEKERGEILTQLYRYAQGRALYDARTLQKIGEFHAASHGVFLTVRQAAGVVQKASARLVSFKTTAIEETVELDGDDRVSTADVGRVLAERLLSRIAQLRVLNPLTRTRCGGQVVALDGFGLFVPERWKIWISVQANGIAWHYPQFPVTLQADGSWAASEVNVGEKTAADGDSLFKVYAVLTDEAHSREIDDYLKAGVNRGLDLSQWKAGSYKVLDNITIIRNPKAPTCG